jgi:hypothetical protein
VLKAYIGTQQNFKLEFMKSYALRLCTDRTKVELQDWNLRSRKYKASRQFFDVEFRILIPRASNLALSLEIS